MQIIHCFLIAFACSLSSILAAPTLLPPPSGQFYHGVYPGGISGDEDDITSQSVLTYEKIVKSPVVWVYFSNNWFSSRAFPLQTASWIRNMGKIPFIRLMLRSSSERMKAEPLFSPQAIAAGKFDADLRRWARAACDFRTPLLVEYGTEANGEWFGWNGRWNGGGPDGPKRFVAAFRHIVTLMRAEGANNISWVIHFNDHSEPEGKWNRARYYYPGDDFVDWIGLSCYGPQSPQEKWEDGSFRKNMDYAVAEVATLSTKKPILLLEFGADIHHPSQPAAKWAKAALNDLFAGRWPNVRGFAWWNEAWENDNHPRHNTSMRVQDSPDLAQVLQAEFSLHRSQLLSRPLWIH